MEPRIRNYPRLSPDPFKAMLQLSEATKKSGLEPLLLELVKIRASQINGCAYCLDMHTLDARALGETEQRINVLDAWREAPFYTARERAALAWAVAVINAWNRIAISFRLPAGTYKPAPKAV